MSKKRNKTKKNNVSLAKKERNKTVRGILDDWNGRINSRVAFEFANKNPTYPETEKRRNETNILSRIEYLKSILDKIKPYIWGLRKEIKEINERTRINASYHLMGAVISKWEAIFLLAQNGKSHEVIELTRSMQECLDLINLIVLDQKGRYVQDWFDGKIISNNEARQKEGELFRNHPEVAAESQVVEMKNYVYQIMSLYPHPSHPAISTEIIDIYTHDLDKNNVAGFHRTYKATGNLLVAMGTTLTRLRLLFVYLKDLGKDDEIEQLIKSLPDASTSEEMEEAKSKFRI